ncbi:MAG: two-component regulator propeller domain-containing protein [Methanobacterium sp.]
MKILATKKHTQGKVLFMVASKYLLLIITLLLILIACSSDNDHTGEAASISREIIDSGYIVPKESISQPEIIPSGNPYITRIGKITKIPEGSNIRLAVESKDIKRLTPVIKTMGENGIKSPKSIRSIEKPLFCKAPEVVLVKDAYIKDINPKNFCSFSKLQGLRHDQIRCLIQDKIGNIWLGTDDGLTKYDGKYFSHYTTDQGLTNNLILSVFQDSKDNIWFGTFRGGVTRYDGRYLTTFTLSGGLPDNIVNSIFEDNAGNLWFGTGGGIAKFDGKQFTNYSVKEGLCHNDVRSIIQDDSGNIWIATNGAGISIFNGNSFSNYSEKEGLAQNFISSLIKDKKGNIWMGTASNGVVKYDGLNFIRYTVNEGLSSNSVRSILQDDEGCLWFGTTNGGVSKFDGKFFTKYSINEGLGSNYIRSILQDRNENLWFGTRGAGLTRFDGDKFTHLTENEGLSNSRVMSILKDNSGDLWFGTFGGYVTKFSSKEINGVNTRYFSQFGKKEGLLNSRIYSIIQDKNGNIWFGSDGGGVSRFDGKITTTYTTEQGLCNNIIRSIYQDREKNYWFASYGSGVSKFNGTIFTNYSTKEGLSSNNVLSILQDTKGDFWFGTDGGGVTRFDGTTVIHYTKEHGFFSNTVYCILEDESGTIWFGTAGEGLIRYDGKSFTKYSEESGLNNNHVLSIIQDSKKNIWVGTRFGVNILKEENLKQIQNNQDAHDLLFKSYNYEDGFIGIGCNLGALAEDNDGIVWIGTNDRLTAFHGERKKTKSIPPNLQITNIQLFNENIPWTELAENKDTTLLLHNGVSVGKFRFSGISQWYGLPENLSLSYKHNYITFNYIGITQTQIKKIKYQYKLDGIDKNWNASTDRTEVSYGNLNHGKYVFKVKAINSEGIWSNEASYHFSIRPPWWHTWWFYLSFILGIIVLIFSFIKYREQRLNHDKQQLQLKVIEQTNELTKKNEKLQIINSEKDKLFSIIAHDLRSPFNSFLGLTQIMSEELPSLTMDEIKDIAVNMKASASNLYNLLENLLQWSRMQQATIPFNPKLLELFSIIEGNMAMLTQDANKKGIEISCNIPDDINFYADSNMFQTIIRNLVSNAIKFTPKGGKVTLSARTTDENSVEIIIKDTGIGMSSQMVDNLFRLDVQINRQGTEGEPRTGLGLLICKDFIEKHGGKLWAESEEGKGSIFYFTIPSNNYI